MRKSYREESGEKVFRYSIRKYHFGAASVAVAALMFFANGAVKADPLVSPATANAGVTNLTEGVPPKENPIEKPKEKVEGDKTPVTQKLVDKSPLVQAISELQAAIAKADEESLLSLSNQLSQLTDENNRLLNGENVSEGAIASQVSRVQSLTEQVRQLKSKTEDKTSNKEDRTDSKAQDKKELKVSDKAVNPTNQTEEIEKADTSKLLVVINRIQDAIAKAEVTERTSSVIEDAKKELTKVQALLLDKKATQSDVDLSIRTLNHRAFVIESMPKTKVDTRVIEDKKAPTGRDKKEEGNTKKYDHRNGQVISGKGKSGLRSIPEDRSAEPPKHPKQVTNGNSLYEINAKNVPDNIYNQPMELFKYWGDAVYNWLDINSKPGVFEKYYDDIDEKNKVRRVVRGTGRRLDQLYRDEYKGNNQSFDIFHDYPTAARVTLQFDVNTAGAKLKVIDGNNNDIAVINVPKDHLFIKQSDWNREEAERQRLGVDRTAAKQAITNAANMKKSAIDSNTGLTAEEKQTARNAVDAAASQAHQNIDNAIDKTGIDTAKNNGLSAIQNVPTTATYKNTAKQEITAAANAKKSAIDGQAGLTAEEKQTAKNAVDAAATQANRNIDNATNQAGVDTAKNNGKQAINAVPANGTAKAAVDTEAEKAKAAIDKATDQAGVDSAKAAGKQAIENVPTTATSKDAAKQEITNAAEAKKSAIDGQAGLTSEEKAAAKAAVDTEAEKAKAAIDKATDQAGVDSAKAAGKQAIENVPTNGTNATTAKEAAKKAIIDAANKKKAEIDANPALTKEEKEAAKKAVDAEAEKAKQEIDKATDQAGIDKAKNDGLTAIENVPTNGTNATTAKEAAKKAITDAANKKKAATDKATDQAGVDSAKVAGKKVIENVPTTATSKDAAKQEITNAAEAKKSAIDGQAGLTAEEKAAAKAAVDETNSRKVATELPNTGTTDSTVAVLAAVASAMLGLSVAGRRRKEDEEA
ncbi:hypothetical protein smi_0810 [Streptococcus mitis B6]|uniref:Gram-positive cocci surface proteins LPxTG domain-containing protein n=1 Tax=Streptococcus mitis (strain B6) TaxID=365659 RepID=D3H865_STRM6|nr:YSIRK signal domain/LPXTG anchor domain surface protein [Streptococcus mitis]CBJ22058.1 hypothetical protein smi_0810 [Streptococcus mitis B6]